jgi:hypothetical protein
MQNNNHQNKKESKFKNKEKLKNLIHSITIQKIIKIFSVMYKMQQLIIIFYHLVNLNLPK